MAFYASRKRKRHRTSAGIDDSRIALSAVHLLRKGRHIFAIWDGSAYRYPRFQFDDAGQPRPETPSLIDLLPRDASGSNRDAALWLFAPDALLDGWTPADAFPEEPERVLRIARRRRGIDSTAD